MTIDEAKEMIRLPEDEGVNTPQRWADLGCGAGTFTLALADLLAPGSAIEAVDLDASALKKLPASRNGVRIWPQAGELQHYPRRRSRYGPQDLYAAVAYR